MTFSDADELFQTIVVEQSLEAFGQLTEMADRNDVGAINWTAFLYRYEGNGIVKPDLSLARHWYRKGAELGSSDAQEGYADLCQHGEGGPTDLKSAFMWFLASATNGNKFAPTQLAKFYELGLVVGRDIEKAIYWYEKGLERGDDDAAIYLGKIKLATAKTETDYGEAFELLHRAAEKRDSTAQLLIGEMYMNGQGMKLDVCKALIHFSLAELYSSEGEIHDTASYHKKNIFEQRPELQDENSAWTDAYCVEVERI